MPVTAEAEKRSRFTPGQLHEARRFRLDDLPLPPAPLAVAGGGHEFCRPDYAIDRENSPYYSVEFVARGRGWLTLGDRGQRLDAGTVFTYGPGVAHRISADPADSLENYFVEFADPRAPRVLTEYGLEPGTVARVSSVCEVQDVFDNLMRDGSRAGGESSGVLCAALAEYLLIKVSSLMVRPGTCRSTACAKFERCRQYIAAHFRRLKTLAQIAQECEIDQAYLCRLFRRFDHQAPYQYLLRLKMTFAAERLRDRNVLVKEVAASVGFADPFHFSHAFKNVLGTSPEVFRRLRE